MINDLYYTDAFNIIHQKKLISDISYDKKYVVNPNITELQYKLLSVIRLKFILEHIGNFNTILDYGYGRGDFIKLCSNSFNAYGFDLTGINVNNVTLINFPDIFNLKFDIITFYDSLEHIPDYFFLNNLNTNYLLITAPECHWSQDDILFEKWKHRKYGEHLHHFNRKSLKNYIETIGYKHIFSDNVEDIIRKGDSSLPNTFSSIYKKV